MPTQPVSNVSRLNHPHDLKDVPLNFGNEVWGWSSAEKITYDRNSTNPGNRFIPVKMLQRKFYHSVEPNGGMTEIQVLHRPEQKRRSAYDLRVVRGTGRIIIYRSIDDSIQESKFSQSNKRSIKNGDAFTVINNSPDPFILETVESPALQVGDLQKPPKDFSLESNNVLPVPAGWSYLTPARNGDRILLPNEYFEAVGRAAAGLYEPAQ